MSAINVYSFDRVAAVVNGIPIVGFFEGDDVVQIDRAEDAVSTIVGADGNALASISTNESAIVQLTLMPTSPINAVLTALELKFRKTLVASAFPLVVTDFSTLAVHASSSAIVLARPTNVRYGKTATSRVWRIFCGRLTDGSIGQL